MFSDLFNPLIQTRFGYPLDARQYHDYDLTKLTFPFENDTTFDINKYVLSSRIRLTRNLSGFTFPTFTTRAERRRVENKFSQIFEQLTRTTKLFDGKYYRLSTLDERLQDTLINVSTSISARAREKYFVFFLLVSTLGRSFPI